MATINLGGSYPATQTIEQTQYPGDNIEVLNSGTSTDTPSTALTIINSTGSEDVLSVTQRAPNHTNFDLNLGVNTNVRVLGMNQPFSTSNYKLDDGATLEYIPAQIGNGSLEGISFDLGGAKSSKLIFDLQEADFPYHSYPLPKISGLSLGDQIQVKGSTQGTIDGTNLVFRDDSGKVMGAFDATGQDLSNVRFDGGTVNYACYLKGTHIATQHGEAMVETLKAGDAIRTAQGGLARVKWLGHRTLYKRRIPAQDVVRAFPVLFKKGALAPNLPHRDLTLSPGHHLLFDGALVPAIALVNGQSIVQQFGAKVFEYFHVELDHFGIILAEGVPAESYADTGNRSMFQNVAEVTMAPEFGPAQGRPQIGGIKVVQQGLTIKAIRKQLLVRAEQLTGARRTDQTALCLQVNGQIIQPTSEFVKEGIYHFALPAVTGDVHILSRSVTVRDVSLHASRDIRRVGIGLSGIAVVEDEDTRQIDLHEATLQGLNAAQQVNGVSMRWTNGHAVIPAQLIAARGKAALELTVLRTYTYWIDESLSAERYKCV